MAKVLEHMEVWKRMGIQVDPLQHWPGESSIADVTTKGKARLQDVEEVPNGILEQRLPDFPEKLDQLPKHFV